MEKLDVILNPESAKNSLLKGNVYDQSTGTPLEGVKIHITDDYYFNSIKKTSTIGYYDLAMRSMVFKIIIEQDGYKRYSTQLAIGENETLIHNINLEPIPKRESIVYGYIYDNSTGSPIIGKSVYTQNIWETNNTRTNVQGYYHFNVVPGDVKVSIDLPNYGFYEMDLMLAQFESYQLNIYLDKL
jgi:hypothetical protein